MIEPHAFIGFPSRKFVIPECPQPSVWMQFSKRVGPPLLEYSRERIATLRLDESIFVERSGFVNVLAGRYDIVIASQYYRSTGPEKLGVVGHKPIEPR